MSLALKSYKALEQANVWRDDEDLVCTGIVPEGPNVKTYTFRSPSGRWFNFDAGQFITLELPVGGKVLHNTYTISSSPSRPLSISITVKAQLDSIGTRWIFDNVETGTKLKVYGPAGLFSFQNNLSDKYMFISAGSGITPMMSMTSFLFDHGEEADICFINCARRPSEIILRSQLEFMATRVPGIKIHYVVQEDDPFHVWTGYRGRLNQLMLGLMAPDYLEREVFCCGPESFMVSVRSMLEAFGFDMSRYHEESFVAPIEEESEVPDNELPSASQVEMIFQSSDVSVACDTNDTVLAIAKSAGLNIPSACTFGVCGTCKVKKLSGDVQMVHNGGISQADIDAGFILACCSKPSGKVVLEV